MNIRRSILSTLGQLFLITLLGIPLVTPLLRWSSVPCTHDGHLHVHRVAAMRHAWENGIYFTRWLPDLAFGYGYPFFIYREPGPLYAILVPHLLSLPLPAASNLFYALAIVAAGWFMLLWVRDVAGVRAGLVSAVAYMAAPYILIDAFVRGNAPESMALPLFPFLLWIGRRWMIKGNAAPFLLAALGLALLSLSHNISLLIFVPSLLVYLLIIGLLNQLPWLSIIGRLALLFGLGLGVTFFYTGGALLEMDQVTLNLSTVTRNNDFHFNFASFKEILAPVSANDPNLVNPPLLIRLGWIPFVLALIGATTPLWNCWISKEQRWHVLLMIFSAAIYLFMALSISLPLWEGLPLINFVQFPWRFIGRAALPVAFLAGMPFMTTPAEVDHSRRRLIFNVATVIASALLILEAIPALYPRYCDEEAFPTIVDVHSYESASGLVGVDPEGSYFPRTVLQRPQGSPLEADYREGNTPQRFDHALLPGGATVEIDYDGLGATAVFDSPQAFMFQYGSFFFPGWSAAIDGEPVSIIPSDPEGLITFSVPPGEHTVTIGWGSTPLRSALTLLSILALTGVAVSVLYIGSSKVRSERRAGYPVIDRSLAIGLILAALALMAIKMALVDNGLTPLHKPGEPIVDKTAGLQAAELQLAGHNLSQEEVTSGDTFDIDLAWITGTQTDKAYQSNVWLADADGLLWSDKETHRPRLFEDGPATWEREAGQWAWDSREVQVLPGTPPGQYDVVLTLFDRDSLQPVTLVDNTGTVIGPTAVIDQIAVTDPDLPPRFKPQYPLETPLDDLGLVLLGFNQDRAEAAPGDLVLLTLFWERAAGSLPETFDIQLLDEIGGTAHTWQLALVHEDFDNSAWESGQRLRAQHLLRLPAGLAGGRYQFQVNGDIPLGELAIAAPKRSFIQPESSIQVEIPFEEKAILSGYTTAIEGDQLILDLVWQAKKEMASAYRVFVHLIDETGTIVSQSDAEPANWRRPTSGWAPGEFIVDRHTLFLPPDLETMDLRLRVGLYDPQTDKRLTSGDSDAADLSLGE